jgi:hypothetical protein
MQLWISSPFGGFDLCLRQCRRMSEQAEVPLDGVDSEPESVDEQLGSPGLTFESGWLLGVALGFIVIVVIGRRLRRRRRQQVGQPSGPGGAGRSVCPPG